jgi:hypothetical protein
MPRRWKKENNDPFGTSPPYVDCHQDAKVPVLIVNIIQISADRGMGLPGS